MLLESNYEDTLTLLHKLYVQSPPRVTISEDYRGAQVVEFTYQHPTDQTKGVRVTFTHNEYAKVEEINPTEDF